MLESIRIVEEKSRRNSRKDGIHDNILWRIYGSDCRSREGKNGFAQEKKWRDFLQANLVAAVGAN